MKNFGLFIILVSFLTFQECYSQNKIRLKSDCEKQNLKGNVQQILESTNDAYEKFGDVYPSTFISTYKVTFNTKGNLVKSETVNDDIARAKSSVEYIYNSSGKIIECNSYGGNNTLYLTEKYIYDSIGNLKEVDSYFSKDKGKLYGKHTFKHDKKGNLTEENSYSGYDENLDPNDYPQHFKNGQTTKYKFDLMGFKIEENYYSLSGTWSGKSSFKNNEKGFPIESLRFDEKGIVNMKNTYKYDSSGNKLEGKSYTDIEGSDNKVRITTYKYESDSKGNWIKKVQYLESKPNTITVREIVYYQ